MQLLLRQYRYSRAGLHPGDRCSTNVFLTFSTVLFNKLTTAPLRPGFWRLPLSMSSHDHWGMKRGVSSGSLALRSLPEMMHVSSTSTSFQAKWWHLRGNLGKYERPHGQNERTGIQEKPSLQMERLSHSRYHLYLDYIFFIAGRSPSLALHRQMGLLSYSPVNSCICK
jgi:hypothetical protein